MDITAIQKRSTSDQVFRILHDRIVSGDLKPGDKLPTQTRLAEQFSVSRNTVREAIQQLTIMGFLSAKPGVGTVVQVSTPARYVGSLSSHLLLDAATVREFLEARLFMEKASVRLAVLRATPEAVTGLREIIDKQKAASAIRDMEQFNDLDAEFHLELARLGRNEVLVKFLETIRDLLRKFISEVSPLPGAITRAIHYHTEITDLIENRDMAAAERKMVQHLQSVADAIQRDLGTKLDMRTLFEIELRSGLRAARKKDTR